jgi:heme oxygenase
MGCLYVLEGSTLGGQMLQRHFKRQLALEEHRGLTFFTGYGPDTPTRWKQFGAWLEQGSLDEAVLLATARQTFLSLEGWFTTNLKTLP